VAFQGVSIVSVCVLTDFLSGSEFDYAGLLRNLCVSLL